jgi:hypothetical protein
MMTMELAKKPEEKGFLIAEAVRGDGAAVDAHNVADSAGAAQSKLPFGGNLVAGRYTFQCAKVIHEGWEGG